MASLPATFQKLSCHTLSSDFRKATAIVSVPLVAPHKNQVLIAVQHVGINASDVNYTAGKYLKDARPPFDCGFECVGTVVAVGPACTRFKVGQHVAASAYGMFAEYVTLPENAVMAVPRPDASLLPLLVSGLTAAIALQHAGGLDILSLSGSSESPSPSVTGSFSVTAGSGKPSRPKTVLVTAAAGATGMFAVQLAKLGGAHVIGTCSRSDKVAVLKRLGCDRVVNYKTENLNSVLHKEYKGGVDVVYESVGGEFLDICIRHLAVKGRLIVIGFISGYSDGSGWKDGASTHVASKILPVPWYAELLRKSATVSGFFLNDYARDIPAHMKNLTALVLSGRLQSIVDDGSTTRGGASDHGKHDCFSGLSDIANAIDHMYRGANIGKVVVRIGNAKTAPPWPSKL